jgi:hypothetical protein
MTVRIEEMTSQVDVQPERTAPMSGDHAAVDAWSRLAGARRARRDLARLEQRTRAEGYDD